MASVFGLDFSPLTQAELASILLTTKVPAGTGPLSVMTANLDHVVQLQENLEFCAAYHSAWVVTADGMPVFVYARIRGAPTPSRVTGSDLVAEVLPALSPQGNRCFFAASCELVAERLRAYLIARGFPQASLAFAVPPHGFERDPGYSDRLARRIHDHGTTHLFFGIGAPKSEVWIHRHRERLGDCYVVSVGAGLDFFARTKRRAPPWMRKSGFEWLWRVSQEPHRLYRRYFVNSWRFIGAVKNDLVTSRS
jgi:N-acetylglucosaminyldiphosphoundecaprenol N-acetyl-beta-D-mannosaminyltransferase